MSDYETQHRRVKDSRYRKQRNLKILRGEPTSLVPAAKVSEHIAKLAELGWSFKALEHMTGDTITDVTLNNLAIGRHQTIERKTAAAALSIPYSLAPTGSLPGTALVPATGAQRRVHALLRLGWNHAAMKPLAGVDTTHLSRGTYKAMVARKWRSVDAMYRQLCMQQGPSQTTAGRARVMGFAPPLAWDDLIDNPDATPVGVGAATRAIQRGGYDRANVDRMLAGDWTLPSTPAEKTEACRRWAAGGGSLRQLAKITGWKIERYYRRGEAA